MASTYTPKRGLWDTPIFDSKTHFVDNLWISR